MRAERNGFVGTGDKEKEAMEAKFQEREAGVAELLDFYTQLEAVYVSASKALEQIHIVRACASTNFA